MENEEIYNLFTKLSRKDRVKLNKLTYRQYLALQYILTVWESEWRVPTKEEIKKIIGFQTDRMLSITLKALDKKGFIKFYGLEANPMLEICEHTFHLKDVLIDKLLMVKNRSSYEEIKAQVSQIMKPASSSSKYLTPPRVIPLVCTNDVIKKWNNDLQIVHRWYEYLEDFPPGLVWEKMDEFNVTIDKVVLDPFVGSGTTCVTGKLRGNRCIGIDANPVASFVSRVKTSWENIDLNEFKKEAEQMLKELEIASKFLRESLILHPALEKMPKMERNQWLRPINQNYVSYVKWRIEEIEDESLRELFLLALVESAKDSSNVSFCPGTSFYPFRKRPSFFTALKNKLQVMYEDLYLLHRANKKWGDVDIYTGDSRNMSKIIASSDVGGVDFIITSPPYPNDLEYTRQTKLELYLLGVVKSEKDIQKIKKQMVKGSTKLIYKDSNSAKYVKEFNSVQEVVGKLREAFSDKDWGWDYPRMVEEYFGDLYLVLNETYNILNDGGVALFVVGDQTYKEILIPVGKILSEIGEAIGFNTSIEVFRVRRSTLHDIPLKEEIVIFKKI